MDQAINIPRARARARGAAAAPAPRCRARGCDVRPAEVVLRFFFLSLTALGTASGWGAVVVGVGAVGCGGVVGVRLAKVVGGGAVSSGRGVGAVDPAHGVVYSNLYEVGYAERRSSNMYIYNGKLWWV